MGLIFFFIGVNKLFLSLLTHLHCHGFSEYLHEMLVKLSQKNIHQLFHIKLRGLS